MEVANNQSHQNEHGEHGEHGEHDDCDDCKRQKIENQNLIQCYYQLDKISSKAKKIKSSINSHAEQSKTNKTSVLNWSEKLSSSPRYQSAKYDIKSMGYQLASLLLEKKTKMQIENRKLHSLIKAMQKQRQQANLQYSQISSSTRFQRGISQDNNNRHAFKSSLVKSNTYQQYQTDTEIERKTFEWDKTPNQRGMRTGSVIIDSTYSSLFQNPKQTNPQNIPKKSNSAQISGLNLWLYQGSLSKQQGQLFSNKGAISTRKSHFEKRNNKKY